MSFRKPQNKTKRKKRKGKKGKKCKQNKTAGVTMSTASARTRRATRSRAIKTLAPPRICQICYDDIDINEYKKNNKVKCKESKHMFHDKCLKTWIQTSATCPTCREPIKSKKKKTRNTSPLMPANPIPLMVRRQNATREALADDDFF